MQMVSIWENIKPATNLNNTLRLVFQPHLGTCGFRHGLECFWLGFKVAEFPVWCIYVKKLAVSGCFLSYFICIYIYIHYTRLLHFIWLVYVWGFLIKCTPHFGGCCFPIPLSMSSFLDFLSVSFPCFISLLLDAYLQFNCLSFLPLLLSPELRCSSFSLSSPHRIPLCIAIKIKNHLNKSIFLQSFDHPPTHPAPHPSPQNWYTT